MSRYDADTGIEGQYEPRSRGRVLRNLKGIHRIGEMHRAEHEALGLAQLRYQDTLHIDTRITAAILRDMHRDWLGGIYAWAGSYRQVEVAKGGFRWPPAMMVARNMAAFESGLLWHCTPCRPDPLEIVSDRLARVHAELLLIHPFREGNGRLARWLADVMIAQANLPTPDYGFEGRESRQRQRQYLHAVIKGYGKDYQPLRDFFAEAVERRLCSDL